MIESFHKDTGTCFVKVRDNESCLMAKNRMTKEYHLNELSYIPIFIYDSLSKNIYYNRIRGRTNELEQ